MLSKSSTARATFVRSCAVIAIATLSACADDTAPARSLAPTMPSLGKNVTGSNQRILFAADIDVHGNYEVYSMNPDGTGITRLTNSPAFDTFAAWSPDGKRIAFASDRYKQGGEIFVMNADGTNVVRVTQGPGAYLMPSWSKDGKKIVFTSTRDAANPDAFNFADYEIYIMNVDGTGITRLTTNNVMDGDAAWSPDGRQLAFVSGRDHVGTSSTDLYVMNVDGTNVTRLSSQVGVASYPSWDPHSRRIAFAVDSDTPDTGIFTILPDGTGLTRLTFRGEYQDVGPSWSTDGTKLAYICSESGHADVCAMNADGSGKAKLTNGAAQHINARWSR